MLFHWEFLGEKRVLSLCKSCHIWDLKMCSYEASNSYKKPVAPLHVSHNFLPKWSMWWKLRHTQYHISTYTFSLRTKFSTNKMYRRNLIIITQVDIMVTIFKSQGFHDITPKQNHAQHKHYANHKCNTLIDWITSEWERSRGCVDMRLYNWGWLKGINWYYLYQQDASTFCSPSLKNFIIKHT